MSIYGIGTERVKENLMRAYFKTSGPVVKSTLHFARQLAWRGLAPLPIIFENWGMTGKVSEDCSRSNAMPIFQKRGESKDPGIAFRPV